MINTVLFIDPKNRWWFFISILFVLGAFVAGVNRSFLNLPTIELHWQEEESWQQYTPSYTNVSGRELVMIYIGSSSCGFSNAPDLPKLIEDTKMSLQYDRNVLNMVAKLLNSIRHILMRKVKLENVKSGIWGNLIFDSTLIC